MATGSLPMAIPQIYNGIYADSFLRNTPASPASPVPNMRNVEGSGTALANCPAKIASAAVVGCRSSQNRYWLGFEQIVLVDVSRQGSVTSVNPNAPGFATTRCMNPKVSKYVAPLGKLACNA